MAKTTLDGYYEALSTELARDNQVFDRNVTIKEIDTKFRKIGDGETPYNDLPYFGGGPNDGGADLPDWQANTAYTAGQEFTFRTISPDAVDIDGTAIPANKTMIGAYRVAKTSDATLTNAEMALIELRGGAGVSNVSEPSLPAMFVTRTAFNRLYTGEINKLKVVVWGDLTVSNLDRFGTPAFLNSQGLNRNRSSYSNLLVEELSRMTGLLVNNNFYCTPFEATIGVENIQKHDTRIVLEGSWSRGASGDRAYGGIPNVTTVTGSKQIFTPYDNFGSDISDTVDLYYRRRDAQNYGSVSVSIDGGTTTLDTRDLASTEYGSDGTRIKWTVQLPRGINTITLTADCTGDKKVPEMVIHLQDSKTQSIEVMPYSWGIDNPLSSFDGHIREALAFFNPSLVVVAANNSLHPTAGADVATVTGYLNAVYDSVKNYADLAYLICPPIPSLSFDPAVEAAQLQAHETNRNTIRSVAEVQGIPVVDMWEQWGSGNWDSFAANGYYTDTSYSAIGNRDIAVGLKALFKEVV